MTRKIGFAIGAALAALLLFGLGKVWAGNGNRPDTGAAPQMIAKGGQIASATSTPDDASRNWRRGRRGGR
jgi:hypothetical protein